MKTKITFLTLLCLLIFSDGFSQYFHFSQFYASPTILAPSFAGNVQNSRFVANYRDQWPSIPGSFVTFAASYDLHFPKVNSGFGALVIRDQAGSGNLGRTDVGILYSWYTPIARREKIYFRPGVQLKMSQRKLDFEKLVFNDMIQSGALTSIEPPPDIRDLSLDATASVLIYAPQFWGGISVDHLFRPNESLSGSDTRVPIKYSFFGGYKFYVGHANRRRSHDKEARESLTASFYYRLQGGYDQFDLGGYWYHEPFTLGLWVRGMPIIQNKKLYGDKIMNLDAIVVLVGYKIFNFTVGYSYDLTVSDLLGTTGGAHEISLIYLFETKLSGRRHHIVSCPNM